MAKFEVIVGNIGIVHEGNNYMKACTVYTNYVKASKAGVGRAANESVTMMHNDDIKREHIGSEAFSD